MIPLESLNKSELMHLQRKIVDRLRYLQRMDAQNKMNQFYFGDVVSIKDKNGKIIKGKVEKFNQKSVSIMDFDGLGWRVSPQLLKKEPVAVLTAEFKNLTNH